MSAPLFALAEQRRTYYGISNKSPISDEKLQELVEQAVKYTPTSFNLQNVSTALLIGEPYRRVLTMVKDAFLVTLGDDRKLIRLSRPAHKLRVLVAEDQVKIHTEKFKVRRGG